ncbi:MAG: S8 family serine peptidase [Promethearchaeia archaeon]
MDGKIYPLFEDTLSSFEDNSPIRCIISFNDKSAKEKFNEKNPDIEILFSILVIPSIVVNLSKEEILGVKNHPDILQIEQDQSLKQCILDIMETLKISEYKTSQITFSGKGIKIGIIDDGIDNDLESIRGTVSQWVQLNKQEEKNLKKSKRTRSNQFSHGSLLTNLLVNQYLTEDDVLLGICPEAEIYDVDISNKEGEFFISDILRAFDLLLQKKIDLDIILIPFSSSTPSDGKDVLSKACNRLTKEKFIIVCPSGNYRNNRKIIGTPAAATHVITVGALKKSGYVAEFTPKQKEINGRIKPEFFFPGESIQIPLSQHNRVNTTGTSTSAAIAVGIIALLKEFNPKLDSDLIKGIFNKASQRCISRRGLEENIRTFSLVDLFKVLNLYERSVIPYTYLMKRSIKAAIEYIIIFSLIFYVPTIFQLIHTFLTI